MTTYTRLTVIGADRRADMVVPDTEPVAAMLPDILALLDHAPGPVTLVTRTGDQLDADRCLADQDVADGTPLWVTPVDQAPPPAQVADITDLVAETHDARPDAWNPTWTLITSSAVVAVLSCLAMMTLVPSAVAIFAGTLVVIACLLARMGKTRVAVLAGAAASGAAIAIGLFPVEGRPPALTWLACVGLLGAVSTLVGIIGFRDRALSAGGSIGALGALGVFALLETGATTVQAAATMAIIAILVVSIGPGLAMTVSGLSGLDDRLVTGTDTTRATARATVEAAYRSLTWTTIYACAVIALCGFTLLDGSTISGWLAIAITTVLVLRLRVLPLIRQRLALTGAATLITVDLLMTSPAHELIQVAVSVCVLVIAVAATARPSPVVTARLNRAGDFLETVAVVALVPLLLASWGVFGDLAGAFG